MKKSIKIIMSIIIIVFLIIVLVAILFQINYTIRYSSAESKCNSIFEYYCENIVAETNNYVKASEYLFDNIDDNTLYSTDLINLFERFTEQSLLFNSAYMTNTNGTDVIVYNFWKSNGDDFISNISILYTRDPNFKTEGYTKITENFYGTHYIIYGHE